MLTVRTRALLPQYYMSIPYGSDSLISWDKENILNVLKRFNDDGTELKFDIVELLVNNGADVNRPDQNGDRPLHRAVKCYWSYFKLGMQFRKDKKLVEHVDKDKLTDLSENGDKCDKLYKLLITK